MAADHHDKSSGLIHPKVPLPVCRWRAETAQGLVCHSTKLVNSPNVVSAAFCASCCYADHVPPWRLPHALPCVHLGPLVKSAVQDRERAPPSGDELFACALHDRCTIADGKQAKVRSCDSCEDYLGRDPFGPDSAQMACQAEGFLRAVPPYPQGRYQGRGVVFAAGGDGGFPGLYVSIRALRHLGCRLPIQVWHFGSKREMPAKRQAVLARYQVECVDADKVHRRHPADRLDGCKLKVFAALHSPFEEVLFLNAHSYPCRNPEFLFELEEYRAQGAIFWPDVNATDAWPQWPAFGLANPRRPGSVDSDQFLLHKGLSWQPLNLAWFYHNHSDYYYRYCRAGKHILEVAWTRCARPFVMWEPRAHRIDVGCLLNGPDHLPLFVSRCADPFSFESQPNLTPQLHELPSLCSSLPLERECREWLADVARLVGQTQVFSRMAALKELPPCRWRQLAGDGTMLCFSENYVGSPNRVAPNTCRMCHYLDHKSAPVYQAHKPIPLNFGTAAPYSVYEPTRAQASNKGAIAIATLYTPEIAELGLLTSGAIRAYAERHGYTAIVARSQLDPSRHPFWSKVVLVEHYLSSNPSCNWLMWIDADVVITKPQKRLEGFLEKDVDVLVAEDPGCPLNAGVFLVRNCAATIYVLRRAYAKTQYLTHPTPEQMALAEALHESSTTVRTRVVSRRLFNSFANEHQKGDFIIHFAAWTAEMKLAGAKQAIASAAAMSPGYSRRQTANDGFTPSVVKQSSVKQSKGNTAGGE